MDAAEVRTWRRAQRQRLLAQRTIQAPAQRGLRGRTIEAALWDVLAARPPGVIGVYWPFRGEFDPRPLFDRLIGLGCRPALPVVIDKKGPLEYRLWQPGEPLVAGVWDIPVPERRDVALPQTVLAPLVGFDQECYRLGYGGGYFDRTLAAAEPRPLAVGVGFEFSRLDTIYPQSFDVPMDLIVTEAGSRRRPSGRATDGG